MRWTHAYLRELTRAADVDERTLLRFLIGINVRKDCARRIEAALDRRGMLPRWRAMVDAAREEPPPSKRLTSWARAFDRRQERAREARMAARMAKAE